MGRVERMVYFGLGLFVLMLAIEHPVFASTTVPEIDGGTIASGFGLLASGVFLLKARNRG